MAPLISVVLPTYNHARFLGAAVASVLGQTCADWELIVVDDRSTDATAEVLAAVTDPRVTRVTLSRNCRLPRALNAGFALTRGEYLTWTSADNELLPRCLEVLAAFLDGNPTIGLVYASHHNTGTRTDTTIKTPFSHPLLLQGTNTIGPCFLYRREVMATVGPYDPDCYGAEDYDMWLRVAQHYPLAALTDVLYVYRHHADSITARSPREIGQARHRAQQKATVTGAPGGPQ